MNNAEELSPLLTNTVSTRKIDLAGEKALLGVDVPDSLDLPGDMPVFLDYQARWFEDESEVCIAEKSRRTGLTWAEAGRNVITAAKPKRRGGRNVFYVGQSRRWRWNIFLPVHCSPVPLTSWQMLMCMSRPSGIGIKKKKF